MYKPCDHVLCRTRTLGLLLISVWMLSEVCASVRLIEVSDEDTTNASPISVTQPAIRNKKEKLPNGVGPEYADQARVPFPPVQVPTSLQTSSADLDGSVEVVPHKKKRQGNGKRRTEPGSSVSMTSTPKHTGADDTNSWAVVPLISQPQSQLQASKSAPVSAEDDHDDDDNDDEDDGVDDLLDLDGFEEEESKETEIDATADDILTDGNYDEKLQTPKDSLKNSAPNDTRPNIILILTDDQDIELGSMEYMPETLKAFRDQGIEFRHGYVTTPMCCPSRSSILTGLYVHNHQVYTNNDNCSSIQWRENFERKTFASYLWDSGYYTSYIGKYLNKYDGSHIPYGWDEWNTLLMNSKFYNYTVNRNGVKIRYGSNYKHDYYPNSIANDTINFLRRMAAASSFAKSTARTSSDTGNSGKSGEPNNKRSIQQPFLLVASFPSPHGPEDSAPEYKDMFLNTTAHHTPSYNHAPNLDKQWILRVTSKMNPTLTNFTNMLMAKRLQTLQSVDLAVSKIISLLQDSGLADNTYVFYTSDHGYHVGQFGLVKGKSMPYEFDIRVPFFVSPPTRKSEKVPPAGIMIYEPVLNIDLAPTFLELGNLQVPGEMDGRSMVKLLKKYAESAAKDSSSIGDDYIDDKAEDSNDLDWTHSFLIESSGRRDPVNRNADRGADSISSTMLRSNLDPSEIFDAKKDTIAKQEKDASGIFTENETTTEIALCQLHPYPCQTGQKKYCRREKNRIRFRKCRYDDDFVQIPPSDGYGTNITDAYEMSGFGHDRNGRKCACPRTKRSTNSTDIDEYDWEKEKQMIDDEIELLKLRIEELRERRRYMRRKFSKEPVPVQPQLYINSRGTTAKTHNHNTFRGQTSDSVLASSFLPISVGHSKRPKKVKNNNVPVPTASSVKNVTFLSAFYLHPKIDFTTFLNIDDVNRGRGVSNANRKEMGSSTFHHSEELFEDYEDQDGVFKEDYDDDPTDYSLTPTKKPSKGSRRNNGSNNEESSQHPNNREKKLKSGMRNVEQENTEDEVEKNQRTARKKTKEHRNKFITDPINTQVRKPGDENATGDNECDCSQRNTQRWLRQQERDERKRKKLLSKLRKKQRFLHRLDDASERQQAETCGSEDKMNCFWHDRSHWRTEPKWTLESFCFCMNANNNTYSCIRTVNSTHNYLYCHFITGFKMYFDLNQDPYQLRNVIGTLPAHEEDWMLATLLKLKKCQGRQECSAGKESISREAISGVSDSGKMEDIELGGNRTSKVLEPSIWESIFGSRKKKHKKNRNRNENSSRQSRKLKHM